MDYSNERYVRIYTRDTDEVLAMSWEARALLWECIRKADRSGLIETRRGARGLAAVCRMPADVVDRVLPELVNDIGAPLLATERGYVLRTFIEAQETPQSDAQRKRESRGKRRDDALDTRSQIVTATGGSKDNTSRNVTETSHAVTRGHSQSQTVTLSLIRAVPDPSLASRTDGQAVLAPPPSKPLKTQRLKRAETPLPSDWLPTEAHRVKARELGVNVEREADRFRDNALAKGRMYVDWNAAFRTWLGNAPEFARRGPNGISTAAKPLFEDL